MFQIPEQLRNILQRLNLLPSFDANSQLTGLVSSAQQRLLLEQLEKDGDWQSIVCLSPLLLSRDETIVKVAAAAISDWMPRVPPLGYLYLDRAMRETIDFRYMINPENVARLVHLHAPTAALGIVSSAGNGHARQAAVQALSKIGDGCEVPFLLMRLADWVPQVAHAAASAIDLRLTPEYMHHIAPYVALLEHFNRCQRTNTTDSAGNCIDRVLQLLKNSVAAPILFELLTTSPDCSTRRASFYFLLNIKEIDILAAINIAFASNDPYLRRQALAAAGERILNDELMPILGRGLTDKHPGVRRDSLNALVSQFPEQAPGFLTVALLDRSASIRSFARYHLLKLVPETDFVASYERSLERDGIKLPIAIVALGEVGSKLQVPLIKPFLQDPNLNLCKAAIVSLAKLDANAYLDIFLNALADPAPGISRAAEAALEPHVSKVGGETIGRIFDSTEHTSIKLNCVRLFNHMEKWDRIGLLLHAAAHINNTNRERVLFRIEAWIKTYRGTWSFTMPSPSQAKFFRSALREASRYLAPPTREFLARVLKSV